MHDLLSDVLIAAIRATPVGYFMSILEQRNPGPNSLGSTFYEPQDYHTLVEAAKTKNLGRYIPIEGGLDICTYIELAIPGKVGVIGLDHLPPGREVQLLDPKNTCGSEGGGVDAYIHEDSTFISSLGHAGFSVAIVGPGDAKNSDGSAVNILWTIHPGHTCPRPKLANDPALVGKWVTVAEAKALGLTAAKVVPQSAF